MSKNRGKHPPEITKQKEAVGWETDIPRCGTCTYFQRKSTFCQVNRFHTTPYAICNLWTGLKGETLEAQD